MNACMEEFMACEYGSDSFYHIHATGKGNLQKLVDGVAAHGGDVTESPCLDVREYIYNMPQLMAAADLILCRAGASTLAEIMACGTAAILVPSPNVTDNHQEKNARVLERAGAAEVLLEQDLTGKDLFRHVSDLLCDRRRLSAMGEAAKNLAHLDATERIYDLIMELVR